MPMSHESSEMLERAGIVRAAAKFTCRRCGVLAWATHERDHTRRSLDVYSGPKWAFCRRLVPGILRTADGTSKSIHMGYDTLALSFPFSVGLRMSRGVLPGVASVENLPLFKGHHSDAEWLRSSLRAPKVPFKFKMKCLIRITI